MKQGKLFQQEIMNSLREIKGIWAYKILDTAGISFSKEKIANFSLPRPADIVGGYKGKLFLIECKKTENITSIPFNIITPNQYNNLKDVADSGGLSFLLINFRTENLNKVLPFRFLGFIKICSMFSTQTGRKSIPLNYFSEDYPWLERIKLNSGKYGWNVNKLFNNK